MHQLKVLILGPTLFSTTLNELKPYLKFNFVEENNSSDFDVILFHEDALKDKDDNKIVSKSPSLKICASSKKKTFNNYDAFLKLPSSLEDCRNNAPHLRPQSKPSSRNLSLRYLAQFAYPQ